MKAGLETATAQAATLTQEKSTLEKKIAEQQAQIEALSQAAKAAHKYFLTKILVTGADGAQQPAVAECVLRGDGAFCYRTIDGAHVGVFERAPGGEPGQWVYREELQADEKTRIEQEIAEARPADYEDKIKALGAPAAQ